MKKGKLIKLECPECKRKVNKKGLCDRCRKSLRPRSTKKPFSKE